MGKTQEKENKAIETKITQASFRKEALQPNHLFHQARQKCENSKSNKGQ